MTASSRSQCQCPRHGPAFVVQLSSAQASYQVALGCSPVQLGPVRLALHSLGIWLTPSAASLGASQTQRQLPTAVCTTQHSPPSHQLSCSGTLFHAASLDCDMYLARIRCDECCCSVRMRPTTRPSDLPWICTITNSIRGRFRRSFSRALTSWTRMQASIHHHTPHIHRILLGTREYGPGLRGDSSDFQRSQSFGDRIAPRCSTKAEGGAPLNHALRFQAPIASHAGYLLMLHWLIVFADANGYSSCMSHSTLTLLQ